MDKFEKICKDIKSVKIQGAESVARAALKALLLKHDKRAVKKLISLRPTEPCLRNAIKFALSFSDIKEGVKLALKHFDEAKRKIAEYGSKLIENNMTVFTHCHSTNVVEVLLEAKKQKKRFEVYCTETRPLFQGRITARELAKAKIPVTLVVDSAARIALKRADIAFIGADAITAEGKVINKIGSEMFAEIASRYDVPFYSCTDSWKFDAITAFGYKEPIEKRPSKEVWKKAPKGVKILNLAFERVKPELVTAIVSELGILKPETFLLEVKKTYPFLFALT